MTGWKKICCAVEFSDASRAAMLEAAELDRRCDGEMTLLHVAPPRAAMACDTVVTARELGLKGDPEAEETLAHWRTEAERVAGRTVRCELREGDPATEILAYAQEQGFDVLVLATRGQGGLRRLVQGSVAEKVVRSAPCSVLVARPAIARGARVTVPSPL
jgi:nucleotide-binding universal stress UspA family protein